MPNRIIREGILSSEPVCSLGWPAEVFYRRLMSVVDDYGRFHASPKLLRAACYPLQIDKVSDADVGKWMDECAKAGLVSVYRAMDRKSYLLIEKFGQQVRSKSRFPEPVDGHLLAIDSSCEQVLAVDINKKEEANKETDNNQLVTDCSPSSVSNCKQLLADDINCEQLRTLSVFEDVFVSVFEQQPPKPPTSQDPSPGRSGQIQRLLGEFGILANSENPKIRGWVTAKVPDEAIIAAIERARESKGDGKIHPGYLDPIIRGIMAESEGESGSASPGKSWPDEIFTLPDGRKIRIPGEEIGRSLRLEGGGWTSEARRYLAEGLSYRRPDLILPEVAHAAS